MQNQTCIFYLGNLNIEQGKHIQDGEKTHKLKASGRIYELEKFGILRICRHRLEGRVLDFLHVMKWSV